MKKITLLLALFLTVTISSAQDVAAELDWTNQADYMINGELVVKPGDVINFSIDYSIGDFGGVDNTFWFILFKLDRALAGTQDVIDGTWESVPDIAITYPSAGTDGTTTGSFTVPNGVELSSTGTYDYRILTYLAYYEAGNTDNPKYGGGNASDKVAIKIMTQAEIDATASTKDFEKETSLKMYPNPVENTIYLKGANLPENYKITNVLGKVIQQGKFENSIDASSLSNGMYILIYDNKTFTKFLKK
ncbi:hypothetical protein BW723_05750 [Polaribacter reichenbachii]|uniref:Secretion system C-terminal sorting domain-containing protein n=1 Tax=Polaribacter reichenbachii TaxID=996801 RepID=A0A1B8TYN0_9FLAO|nr:T9SS type A sorting domain-containing protein [Polaribacter reichenbachii]APZ45830.1 hypothetical protein BW723_05750 [Polaribacter reichenbachii]AUC19692.1 hypothetical protein BTO17_13765 [Polaribacter reichenbachii]OBY64738.1 hypothetical protein LPB301_09960 [Polaribacter reichenbachii]